MPLGSIYTLGPSLAGNAALIVAAAAVAGAGPLALVGAAAQIVLDVPRKVLVTSGVEGAARKVTIKGIGFPVFGGGLTSGQPISEVVNTAAAGGTTTTIQDFAAVTGVSTNGAFANNLSVGTQSIGNTVGKPVMSTPWYFLDPLRNPVDIGYGAAGLNLTNGFLIEATFDDPNAAYESTGANMTPTSPMPLSNIPPKIWADPGFGAALKTTDFVGSILFPYMAVRLSLYDTGAATALLQIIQAGLHGG